MSQRIFALLLLMFCQNAFSQTPSLNSGSGDGFLTDAWFSPSSSFPMSTQVCDSRGECTPGGLKRNQIVLTFDDGPNANTLKIVDILNSYRIRATFFVHVGQSRISNTQRSILDAVARSGHKIANHGRTHSPLNGSTSGSNVVSLLMDTHDAIERYFENGDIAVYRNPGGYWSSARSVLLNDHNTLRHYVGPIFWNVGGDYVYRNGQLVDAADWRCQQDGSSASRCAGGYLNRIFENYNSNRGSLVLMHDIHSVTVEMLPLLLEGLRNTNVTWEFLLVQDIPAVQSMVTDI